MEAKNAIATNAKRPKIIKIKQINDHWRNMLQYEDHKYEAK